jgi:GR25 family glycosyltransferase involved in LPS biosynthesis
MWDQFEEKYVLTLRSETNRHVHIIRELQKVGLHDYVFVYGVTPEDEEVKEAYRQKKVSAYPPCFRCGQNSCACENNILIPSQIACFISYKKLFERAVNSLSGTFLVMEDDVEFEDYAKELAERAFNKKMMETLKFDTKFPVLMSLGQNYFGNAPKESRVYKKHHWIAHDPSCCNVTFAFNRAYAKLFLDSLHRYTTTSDIFIHDVLNRHCNHYTLNPRISHDLSWSTGDMKSTIHPKKVFIENDAHSFEERESELNRYEHHIQRVNTKEEYHSFLANYLMS